MQAAILITEVLLRALPMITVGTQHLMAFVASVRTAAKQTGEWTPELETLYQNRLLAEASAAHAQPDEPQAPV